MGIVHTRVEFVGDMNGTCTHTNLSLDHTMRFVGYRLIQSDQLQSEWPIILCVVIRD